MLGRDLALALDPVRLVRRAGIEPDEWQARLLRSSARQILMNCSRQSGKSTTAAGLAAHAAIYEPGAPILCLSPSERQSKELFRTVKDTLMGLGSVAPRLIEESALKLELANRSRVLCLPGKEATVRGFAGVRLLLVDEASRVPDDLYQAIRPMLAVSGGRLVLLSTPFGRRGFFHQEWTEGGDAWERVKITAAECPRIPKDWLEAEREAIGEWWFAQEYQCEFVDTLDQVFRSEDIDAALDDSILPLFAGPHGVATENQRVAA